MNQIYIATIFSMILNTTAFSTPVNHTYNKCNKVIKITNGNNIKKQKREKILFKCVDKSRTSTSKLQIESIDESNNTVIIDYHSEGDALSIGGGAAQSVIIEFK